MSGTDRRAMRGYVIDESIQVGDMCWQGPLKLVRGQMAGALFTSADNDVLVIPDVPNLPAIVRYLADHPETVDALETSLYNQGWFISAEKFNLVKGLLKAMRGEGGHE